MSLNYKYEKGPSNLPLPCPGLYCGRTRLFEGTFNFTSCRACPRGTRVLAKVCEPCQDMLTFYDWLYLGFMVLFGLVLHWIAIDRAARPGRLTPRVIAVHFSAVVESALAAFLTILFAEPMGSLEVKSCHVKQLSDWYTMFYNPNPNYEETLHCTQEAVYPLYSIVFVYYAWAIVLLLIIRPWMMKWCMPQKGKAAIYSALYFLPILAFVHAVFGGLIYYSYPYIVFLASLMTSAFHFASQPDQTWGALKRSTFTNVRNLVVVVGHWLLHAYGIIAITQLSRPVLHAAFLALVPLPSLFYVATVKFTDPDRLFLD
nr:EOG090X0BGA [Triops cancriformis]